MSVSAPTPSTLQVGHNPIEGFVKLHCPDGERPPIVQVITPTAARELAAWLEDGTPSKVLRICDGRRWVEHEVPATCTKLAADLRS